MVVIVKLSCIFYLETRRLECIFRRTESGLQLSFEFLYNFTISFFKYLLSIPSSSPRICHKTVKLSAVFASFLKRVLKFPIIPRLECFVYTHSKKHNKILPKRSRINFSLCEEGEKNMRNSSASSHQAGSHLHRVSHTSTL